MFVADQQTTTSYALRSTSRPQIENFSEVFSNSTTDDSDLPHAFNFSSQLANPIRSTPSTNATISTPTQISRPFTPHLVSFTQQSNAIFDSTATLNSTLKNVEMLSSSRTYSTNGHSMAVDLVNNANTTTNYPSFTEAARVSENRTNGIKVTSRPTILDIHNSTTTITYEPNKEAVTNIQEDFNKSSSVTATESIQMDLHNLPSESTIMHALPNRTYATPFSETTTMYSVSNRTDAAAITFTNITTEINDRYRLEYTNQNHQNLIDYYDQNKSHIAASNDPEDSFTNYQSKQNSSDSTETFTIGYCNQIEMNNVVEKTPAGGVFSTSMPTLTNNEPAAYTSHLLPEAALETMICNQTSICKNGGTCIETGKQELKIINLFIM